jgi:hypothetical protein
VRLVKRALGHTRKMGTTRGASTGGV